VIVLDEKKDELTLEWKDWIALFIASLQTVFLPLILMALVLLLIYFLFLYL
jgi:hypothetical protein